ncbi:MAG: hypothetical protein U0163_14990 [Gemmatimonadaceae bacterium]
MTPPHCYGSWRMSPYATHRLPRNRGKGYGTPRDAGGTRCIPIFTDADLAYPLEDLEGILLELQRGRCRGLPRLPQSRYLMSLRSSPSTRHRRAVPTTPSCADAAPGLLDSQAGLKACRHAPA